MSRRTLPALALLVLLAGCGGPTSYDSPLPTSPVADPPGPAYVAERLVATGSAYVVSAGGRDLITDATAPARWLTDGRVLVDGRLLDATTGRPLSSTRLPEAAVEVSADAITLVRDRRIEVRDLDLAVREVVEVPDDAVDSDQIGPDSPLAIHDAHTLDGVTWTQWSIDSENDELTDHGLLRIEGDEIVEAQRGEPVVRLETARDGGALLAVMQDDGSDEDCGGCVVDQTIVELDPDTGETAIDYGTPPGYTADWRIGALDKVGDRLVVQYDIGEGPDGEGDASRPEFATWVHQDGGWTELREVRGTITRWQDGGRLVWRQTDATRDAGEGAAYDLTWHPGAGEPVELGDTGALACGSVEDVPFCPPVSLPGSLLPPG